MSSLPLVIEAVDLIDEASKRQHLLDADAEAERLVRHHPEADATKEAVAEMIREERRMPDTAHNLTRGRPK